MGSFDDQHRRAPRLRPPPIRTIRAGTTRIHALCIREASMEHLISTFRIAGDEPRRGRSKGRIVPCEAISESGFPGRITQYKNYRGFSYEENHLEEWIARQPSALFGPEPVLLLASQNYVHLRVKIDLLFVDSSSNLYPVEIKVVRVAKNGGVVPYDLYERQMKPYVEFLKGVRHLRDLDPQYARFAAAFGGAAVQLDERFRTAFGHSPTEKLDSPVREVYVAERFDTYAIDYFEHKSKEDRRSVRLVAYKFFPKDDYLEFWDVFQSAEEPK